MIFELVHRIAPVADPTVALKTIGNVAGLTQFLSIAAKSTRSERRCCEREMFNLKGDHLPRPAPTVRHLSDRWKLVGVCVSLWAGLPRFQRFGSFLANQDDLLQSQTAMLVAAGSEPFTPVRTGC